MARVAEQEINLLRALEIFVAVAETGAMTSAGQMLGMTQSAISQQIHNLEESIGTPLIDRDLRPLRLTIAGLMLLDRAQQLLLDVKGIQTEIRSAFAVPIPRLRFGVLSSLAGSLVPQLVFALLDQGSVKSVSVWGGFAHDHLRALLNRELDLILVADPLYEVAGLERHELFSEPFILLVPRAVPVHHVTFSSLLESIPLIRHSSRSPIGLKIEQHLRRLRIVAPMYVEFDSIESIISAVSLGKGWAISAPTLLLQGLREQHSISVRALPPPGFSRSFALLARSGELGNAPSAIAQLARQILKEAVLPRVCTMAPFLKNQFEIPSLGEGGLGEH